MATIRYALNCDRPPDPDVTVYYAVNGIRVTATHLIVHGDAYALAPVQRVTLDREPPHRLKPLMLMGAGVLLLVFVIGVVFLLAGVGWWMSQRSVYWVVLHTGTQRLPVHHSSDLPTVQSVVAAVTLALGASHPAA